ncbi:MAG: protein translocase subunit SecF [Endomicrobiales bacterium]|nr:protein translocase subunit SecF [Endomicrobiales bacterium]
MILAGAVSLVLKGGPNLGIDFKGGVLLQLSFSQSMDLDTLRGTLTSGGIDGFELQSTSRDWIIIRVKKTDITQDELSEKLLAILKEKFPDITVNIESTEYVGPAVGRHLFKQAFFAIIFSLLGIIVYVAFRFHSGIWGTAGVLALAHDVFLVLGLFSILDKEITLTVVAALLTLAGFSINDTIVIFDRIRENTRLLVKEELGNIINRSVNETLSRTIITSLTVFFVVLTLFLFGGDVIHDFAFALLIGVVVGSYSTIFVASPIVYEWQMMRKKRISAKLRGGGRK